MLRSNLGAALAFMLAKFAEMDHPRSALTLGGVVTPSKAFRSEARRKLPFNLNRYHSRSCYTPHQGEREKARRRHQLGTLEIRKVFGLSGVRRTRRLRQEDRDLATLRMV